jgi:hypothetical protein
VSHGAANRWSDNPDNMLPERLRVPWLREIQNLIGEVRTDTADIRLRIGMLEGDPRATAARHQADHDRRPTSVKPQA